MPELGNKIEIDNNFDMQPLKKQVNDLKTLKSW